MNRLKLSGSRWAGYTGNIGTVDFKDGISAYPVPRNIADRLSAAIAMVEVDEEGNELGEAGVVTRVIRDSALRAPVLAPLERQTEAERKVEDLRNTLKANKAPTDTFYTVDELHAIVDEKGIKGLRAIAEPWNVKGKAIPALIEAIIASQNKFLEGKNGVIAAVAEIKSEEAPQDEVIEQDEVVEQDAPDVEDHQPDDQTTEQEGEKKQVPDAEPVGDLFANAAATGDMSAAISTAAQE